MVWPCTALIFVSHWGYCHNSDLFFFLKGPCHPEHTIEIQETIDNLKVNLVSTSLALRSSEVSEHWFRFALHRSFMGARTPEVRMPPLTPTLN